MFDHVSIGVRDLARARRFYDATLKPLGYARLSTGDGALGYGAENSGLWVLAAERPVAAEEKSGLHFCFAAPTRAAVDAFHAAALAAGGKDNGKPGLRTDYGPNYYAAFALDPDGYRLEAYCGKAS
jgi:catechol 2,3-dioxygenase-like lactoylglutathione lyase family enzyme